jgi:IS605 OrfB family transposase
MKLVVQTQLLPDAEQAAKLRTVVERFNEAANHVAGVAFDGQTANVFELRKLCYAGVRAKFGLSSQMAQLAIKAARDAYCRDKSKRPKFRKHAAVAYDRRIMSFKGIDRVSLLTLEGRIIIPFILGQYQRDRIGAAKGQCDLVLRKDGKWFLIVTVDVPEGSPIPVTDFIGVDLGIVQIATDSDGNTYSGAAVNKVRVKHNLQRKRLQKQGTKGAKKKLKRVSGKEARFRKHENHCISKSIVETAKRTSRGIAVEELNGIRQRVTARGGDARNRLSGWSFFQLFSFLAYKAPMAGIPIIKVDPRYTSQTCPECRHCERSNRKSQSEFRCKACGHEQHADIVGARNIRDAALSQDRALVPTRNGIHRTGQPSKLSRKAAAL